MKPLVSVCIANYNGDAVIQACLESVLAQETDFDVEIIVHDDCSTDNSVAFIRGQYPSVRLLTSEKNVGFCISNNRMAAEAQGDYLLLLNNDTRLHAGAIEALLSFQKDNSSAGILTLPQFNLETGELLDRGMFMDLFANPIPNTRNGTREVATVMGSCLWIARELWEGVGGFPDWFESIAEDMYLCCRVRLLGRKVVAIDDSGYDHCVGLSFGGGKVEGARLQTSLRRRTLSELNKNRVMSTCYPGHSVMLLVPHVILLLVEGAVLCMVRRRLALLTHIYLPAIFGIIFDWHRLDRLRRSVQATRRVGIGNFFGPFRFTHHKVAMLRRFGFPSIRTP